MKGLFLLRCKKSAKMLKGTVSRNNEQVIKYSILRAYSREVRILTNVANVFKGTVFQAKALKLREWIVKVLFKDNFYILDLLSEFCSKTISLAYEINKKIMWFI